MRLDNFKLAKIIAVTTVIGIISVLSTLFFPSSTYMLSVIIAIFTVVISCIGIIVITYQGVKYGEILKKTNVKEYYKLIIFMVIYTAIMLSIAIFVVVDFIYVLVISGIVLGIAGIALIFNEVYFRISIRKIESIE